MPSGGARSRSGPPPDPNALRRSRNTDAAWTTLPAEGRTDPAPEWPLVEGSRPDREMEVWRELWRKPQAVMWEHLGMELEVALYVRKFCEVELPDASAVRGSEVRLLGESLGLTIPGMTRFRWKIAGDEVGEKRAEVEAPAPRASSRDRLTVVNDVGSA